MAAPSTRRFEMGLPLFSGLDLGSIAKAQIQIESRDLAGLTEFVSILANAATARTIRKLAAIWQAPESLLKLAETDPAIMAALESDSADAPFSEMFKAAMDFQSALWQSLGATPASSAPAEQKLPAADAGVSETSEGSPSES